MSIDEYMKLPYTSVIREMNDESGHYYIGRIIELDGCVSDGDTPEEVMKNLEEAKRLHIEESIERGCSCLNAIKR